RARGGGGRGFRTRRRVLHWCGRGGLRGGRLCRDGFGARQQPERRERCPRARHGSSTRSTWSALTRSSVCVFPLGQRISSERASASAPRPKCNRLSLEDRKPPLSATWLCSTRPPLVVSFTF